MKKILLSICLIISINAISQCSGTNNLQLEVRHWYWAVNKFAPIGVDSTMQSRIRGLRTQLIAANPADSTTLVTITNVPNEIITSIYQFYSNCPFSEYFLMGSTDAERRTIFTNIRAIVTPCVVAAVASIDADRQSQYWQGNKNGKAILKDTQ